MADNFATMSETAYYILLSLMDERHGYGIMQHVARITEDRINLGAGTIYGTLGKLEKNGMIKSTRELEKRKYYIITEQGQQWLRAEVQRLRELYENGKGVLDHEG